MGSLGSKHEYRLAIPRDNLLPSLFWTFVCGLKLRFSDHVRNANLLGAGTVKTAKDG